MEESCTKEKNSPREKANISSLEQTVAVLESIMSSLATGSGKTQEPDDTLNKPYIQREII